MSVLLYYVPGTRAVRVRWMLEEMNHPYELMRIDPKKDENDTPEYRALQPLGHVPVVVAGSNKAIFESAAIVAWLADRHPEKKLCPPLDAMERGTYYQWLFFAMATLEPPLQMIFNHTKRLPEEKRIPAMVDPSKERFREVAAVVDKEMATKPFIMGNEFSAADVVLGGCFNWARGMKVLDGFENLREYTTRLIERPAFQRAIAD